MAKDKDQPDNTNALAVIKMNYDGNVFFADFEAMEKAARAYAKQFDDTQIVTDGDRKKAKDIRAEINGRIKEINAARIALYKQYDEPKADFTLKCNGIIAILEAQSKYIDDGIKRKDEEFRSQREALLLHEYEATAMDLMAHIPLAVYIRHDTKLLGRTWDDAKACKELSETIITAVHDRETIKANCQEFHVEADMEYCQSLDLRLALERHAQLVEQRKQREEHERLMRDAALVDDHKPGPTPESKPVQASYPTPAKRRGEPVREWSFDFRGTRSQAEQLAKYAREIGVTSDGIKAR